MALLVKDKFQFGENEGRPRMVRTITRQPVTLPASGAQTLWTNNDYIYVWALWGQITTAIQAQACNLSITHTSGLTSGDALTLASDLDIQSDPLGDLYYVEGDGTALVGADCSGRNASVIDMGRGIGFFPVGTFAAVTNATNTGQIKWFMMYEPLVSGARVTRGGTTREA